MKEVALADVPVGQPAGSLLACIATILELPPKELPELRDEESAEWTISRWLGGYGVGLVPIATPDDFAWPGPWIACLDDGRARRHVVMYGVPSALVWDPAAREGTLDAAIAGGFVLAAADIALARPARPKPPNTTGVVEALWVAASAGESGSAVESARVIPGRGVDGDRYATGAGTFPTGPSGSALTLIEVEVCEAFTPPLGPAEHRRNIVTRGIDLNALVRCEFTIGDVRCRGVRLCEPCRVLEGYATRPLLRSLVHRGGLRADIVTGGTIRLGDPIRAAEHEQP